MRNKNRMILTIFSIVLAVSLTSGLYGATPNELPAPNAGANDSETRSRQAAGAQRARELDLLFKQLMSTSNENEGRSIVNTIWLTWHRSGDRKVNDLISLATIYMDEGEFAAALPKLNEVVMRAPDFPEGWNRRATLLFLMGEFERSLADIMQTLKLEPRHFGALAGRGLIYNAQGQYAKALEAFEQALKFNPFLSERNNLIPILREKLGQQKI